MFSDTVYKRVRHDDEMHKTNVFKRKWNLRGKHFYNLFAAWLIEITLYHVFYIKRFLII